ncbi:MAG: hypothetical protein ACNS62_12340 [Candidatus Cyclobacteriaceae bacterium M3_2C_046]
MKRLFVLFVAVLVLLSCERPPELENIPRISFEDVEFKEGSRFDTLVVSVYFEDGNGDIGLRGSGPDTEPPYHLFEYVTDDFGEKVELGSRPGLPPYNKLDYVVEEDENGVNDTIFIEFNEDYFNFFVDLYTIEDGVPVFFDFRKPPFEVIGFYGRIPYLKEGETDDDRPLEGTIRYRMQSAAWLNTFSLDSLQLNVYIKDRALNKSNVVESPVFTLLGIMEDN